MGLDVIHFVMKYFAKFILHPLVRPFVLLFFGLTSTAALAMLFRIEVGLDQTLALPQVNAYPRLVKVVEPVGIGSGRPYTSNSNDPFHAMQDSYLLPYFNETFTYLHTGAPVYFVIKDGYDYTDVKKQNTICSGAGCLPTSLGQQIVEYSTAADM